MTRPEPARDVVPWPGLNRVIAACSGVARLGPSLRLSRVAPLSGVVLAGYIGVVSSTELWTRYVALAVTTGYVSTLLAILLYSVAIRKAVHRRREATNRVVIEPIIWGWMSVVLFTLAIDFFTRAIHRDGLYWLASRDFNVGEMTTLDLTSVVLALAVGVVVIGSARVPLPDRPADLWRLRRSVIFGALLFVGLFVLVAILLRLALQAILLDPMLASKWTMLYTPINALFGGEREITFATTRTQVVLGALALWLIVHSHINGHSLVDQALGWWLDLDSHAEHREPLRMLAFDIGIAAPLIVGVAIVAERSLHAARAGIYGLFLYGGYVVWSLSIDTFRAFRVPESPPLRHPTFVASLAVTLVFLQAALVTITFVVTLASLRGAEKVGEDFVGVVLSVVIGVILIQRVYGHMYKHTWGSSLSDQWSIEMPTHAIFGVILSIVVAAWSQGPQKLIVFAFALLLLLGYPVWMLSRRLSAYVLIKARPGAIEHIEHRLKQLGLPVTVVSGEYDLVCRLEVRRQKGTGNALKALAAQLNERVRTIPGVRETETLVDFSHVTPYRQMRH